MLAESESILPTVQLAITSGTAVALAWIAVQQVKAKTQRLEAARKLDALKRGQEDMTAQVTKMQTQIKETDELP